MAYLKTLGVIATMTLGAAGFAACSGGKTEQQTATNPQEVKKDTVPKQVKKDSVTVMPPLTKIDFEGDTLVFNSKQDSIDYIKYNTMAHDTYWNTYTIAKEKSDSMINAEKENYRQIQEEEQKEWGPKLQEIIQKRKQKLDDLDEQYGNGKISFKQLESAKQKVEQECRDEQTKLFAKYTKGDNAERKTDLLEKLEDRRIVNVNSEAYTKYLQDRDEMRKKYCKEVRPYQDKPVNVQVNFANDLTIDGVKVKWKSEADSIAANEYLRNIIEKEQELNAKIDEQMHKLDEQIARLEAEQEQLEYDAAVLYEKGNKSAAMNKQTQIEKNEAMIEQLEIKQSELDEKYQFVEWDIDTINKHSVQQFSKDWKKIVFPNYNN